MEIKQLLIPKENHQTRPGLALKPQFITIHETDNPNAGANAYAHARLQYNGNSRTASWHYTCDDKEIWQSIPDNEVSWHAGDGKNGPGNRTSLSIEICVNEDGDFEQAKKNAIWLVRKKMAEHHIPLSNVVPHQKWSGKNCPRHILTYWKAFIAQIQAGMSTPVAPKPAIPKFERYLKLTVPLMRGNDVKLVQQKVKTFVDGWYGPLTRNAVISFQKRNGLVADGIVGPKTWAKLFA